MTDYTDFLSSKTQGGADSGFAPVWMPDFLFDFQAAKTEWAIRKGRAANIADCGLGKTPMSLVWGSNVARKTGKPTLYLNPCAVGPQVVREAEKFGIEARMSRDGSSRGHIVVTNYEKLHLFEQQRPGSHARRGHQVAPEGPCRGTVLALGVLVDARDPQAIGHGF